MNFPRIFHANLSNVHHAAFWLAAFSALSALLGLFRDRLLASTFGASRELDVYYAAFRVPDMLYTLMLFFAASTAIIPIFLDAWAKDRKRAEELFGALIGLFCAVLVVLAAVLFFVFPRLASVLFSGFSLSEQDMVVRLGRIMLLSPFFLGLSNIFSSITQAFRRFFVYAISPVLYNIGIIIGIVFFLPSFGLAGLAWGVALGAFFHMAIQIPSLRNASIVPRFSLSCFDDIGRVVALSAPRTLGLVTTQLVMTVFAGVASTLAAGSLAVFSFASNLEYIPVTLVGLSYSVAAFPNLAEFSIKKSHTEFQQHFALAFRHILFWSLPFAVLLLVLRAQIVRVVLGAGSFSWTDTRLTAAALFLLSIGVMFQSLFLLLVRALYAEGQTLRPVLINVVSALLSIGGVFWFLRMLSPGSAGASVFQMALKLRDIPDIRALALPLGILIGSAANFVFLFFVFGAALGWFPTRGIERAVLKIAAGSVVGGLVAYGGLNIFSHVFDLQTFFGIFFQGLCAGVLGIGTTIAVLWALRSEELSEIYRGMRGMIWKDHIPAPEPEKLP
ncbi:MAG TPA: lipid II flippase MurJ [Candidatus Paceibacterota bacterium]